MDKKMLLLFITVVLWITGCSLPDEESQANNQIEQYTNGMEGDVSGDAENNPSRAASALWKTYTTPTESVNLKIDKIQAYFERITNGNLYYNYHDGYYKGILRSKSYRVVSSPYYISKDMMVFPMQITYEGYVNLTFTSEIGRYCFSGNLNDDLTMGPGIQYGKSYEYLPGIDAEYESGTNNYAVTFYNSGTGNDYVNDYVQLPNTKVSTEFTISLWTNFRYNSNPYYEAAILSFGRCRIENSFAFFVTPDGKVNAVIASQFGGSNLYWYGTAKKSIKDNRWHHLAATYKNRVLSFYVDGRLIGTRTLNSYHNPNFYNLRQFIALHEWYTGKCRRSCFNGTVDVLRIFTESLSAIDISSIFAGENPYN